MNQRTWTISNILSVSRIVLAVPIVFLLLSDERLWAVVVMSVAGLTDLFDGIFARAFHQETDLGKILDPFADKIAIAAIAIVLAMLDFIPLWFLGVVVARDLLILLGGMYVKIRKRIVLQSNTMGKWAVTLVGAYIILSTINIDSLATIKVILLALSTITLGVSFALYVERFVRVIHQE